MVSIIILVQDRYDMVARCLKSIVKNTETDYELVLIIQGPVETRILDLIKELPCKKTVVFNKENTGVTPGRNLGIQSSKGDYLLFFDDDAFVEDEPIYASVKDAETDWLGRMKRYFKLDKVGIVGQSGYVIDRNRWGIFLTPNDIYADVAQGYCFMFSREVVDTIGLLDENYGKFWHEESDYALNAKYHGFKVINAGHIGVYHLGSGSGDDGSYGRKLDYMKNKWSPHFSKILEMEMTHENK